MRRWWRRRNDRVSRIGDYELRVRLVHGGTRSEGRIGRLFLDGRELRGTVGDRIELADGRSVIHLGDERPHAWSVSGWAIVTDQLD